MIEKTVFIPRQYGFVSVIIMQNGSQLMILLGQLQIIPRKIGFFAETYNNDAFAVLRRKVLSVNNAVMDFVAQFIA